VEQQHIAANPFALLLDPEAVHAALQQSTALTRLKSRVWRPLDRTSGPISSAEPSGESEFEDGQGLGEQQ
jgi:hypothetical protein